MKKEIDADEQEAFIREVTEEVKNDNLKQMWEKYGIYIILLVVLAIVGAVSFEGFKSWRQAKSETWSERHRLAGIDRKAVRGKRVHRDFLYYE